jgi:hypothetical protein
LIATLKRENPVAATFLRAVHPVAVSGQTITVQVQFSLHLTFFEKPGMAKLIGEKLSELIGETVIASFVLDETPAERPRQTTQQRRQEEFQQTVQEIFGTA